MIIECDAVDKDQPLRQGDIFRFLKAKNIWEEFGVIITTDCDIAQNKNSDVYSYCPIININTYFHHVWLPTRMDIYKVLEKIKGILDKNNKNQHEKGIDITSIHPWVMERGVENAIKDVEIYSPEFKTAISFIYNYYTKCLFNIDFLFSYRSILGHSIKRNDVINNLQNDFINHINRLPGDLFYINYIHVCNNYGYVVNLRRIGIFARENIIISNDIITERTYLERVGRMMSPFNYRLTQKVAQMFSDIGLPEDYEEDRKSNIEMFFSNLMRKQEKI